MAKDKPVKVKKEKAPKPEKGDKSGKSQQKYFWTAFMEKRKKGGGGYVREPSIPKPVTSKEDKLKLMAALAIVVLVPVVFVLMSRHNAAAAAAKAAADNSPNRSNGTENAAMKAAGADDSGG